jgi:MFS family permease
VKSILKSYDVAVWVRFLGQVITSLGGFMIGPFITLYMYKQLHIGLMSTMAVTSVSPFVGMLTGLVAGRLSDRLGRKPMMMASLFGQGVAMLFFAFVHHAWQIVFITLLDGAASALYWPAANAQITDVVPEHKRGEVFSLLHMGLNVGAAVGPTVGAIFFQHHARILFFVSAACTFSTMFLIWTLIPETRRSMSVLKSDSSTAITVKKSWSVQSVRAYLPVVWITLLSLPVSLLYAQVRTNLPIHLSNHFANYTHVFAIMMTFNGIVVILLQMLIARLARDRAVWKLVAISYLSFGLVGIGYAFAPSLGFLLGTEFVFAMGEMVGLPQLQHVVGLLAPEDQRGSYFALFNLRWTISETLGPLFGGLLMRFAGGKVLFVLIGALILASGTILVLMLRAWASDLVTKPAGIDVPELNSLEG